MKKIFFLLLVLLFAASSFGQHFMVAPPSNTGTPQPGDQYAIPGVPVKPVNSVPDVLSIWALPGLGATSANTRIPGNTWKFQRTEYLITPAEMAASGYPSGQTIDGIGFIVYTAGATTQSGNFKVYLRNTTDVTYTLGSTWTTTGFTLVSDIASWTVPIAVGPYTVNFSGGSPFTYTGGGVYVAWEFSNTGTAGATALVADCNTTLTGGLYGNRSATAMPTALTASNWRPGTMFINNSLTDVVQVNNIYTTERAPLPYGAPVPCNIRVSNVSAAPVTFDLTVTIKDATNTITRYTNTQTVTSLAASTATIVNYSWTPTVQEDVNITVTTSTLAGETFTSNNTLTKVAEVNNNRFSLNYSLTGGSGFGFTYPGTGLFATKFHMTGTGAVNGANLFISSDAACTGNTVYAVVLNSAGTILDQSASYVILAGDLGTNKSFTFPATPTVTDDDFYVALAQTAGAAQWYPMGTFNENPMRTGTFYTGDITGGTMTELTGFNLKYGIEAIVGAPPSIINPSPFTATAVSDTEIDLAWSLNPSSNNVLVAWNTTATFGTPASGTTYSAGNTLPGGGTVLQYNNATSYNHTGLTPNTTYYYKAWSYNGSQYSSGIATNGTTFCSSTPGPWTQDFESTTFPPTCWAINAGSGTWAHTTAASGYGTGTGAAFADFYNISGTTPFALFTMPFTNGTLINPKIAFDYAYATYAGEVDEMDVYYSTDNGATFNLLLAMPGGTSGILNTGGTTTSAFVPTAAQWASMTLSLPTGTNMVAFNAISAFGNSLYLDNVRLIEGDAHDVATLSIDDPGANVVNGATIGPKATVKNMGIYAETFDVTMTATGGYSSTKTVISLAAGATQQVTFDNWTPPVGQYAIMVCTSLSGDMVVTNDCKTQTTGVYTGSWANTATYPTTNYLGASATWTDNSGNPHFYSIGGNTGSGLGTECYDYNVNTATWAAIASLPDGRRVHTAVCQGNYVYAIGGSNMSSVYQTTVYRYDIAGNTWSTVAPLPVAIGWGRAVAYGTNYIYLAGGVDGSSNYLATVYLYDVTANTWTAATSMPGDKFGGAFAITGNTLVYTAGSSSTGISSSVYVGTISLSDPLSITWATKSPYPGLLAPVTPLMDIAPDAQAMPKDKAPTLEAGRAAAYPAGAMYRFDGATWGDDAVIVAGGSPTSAWTAANPSPCYMYEPATDTWTKEPNVTIPALGAATGSVTDGAGTWKLILAGGLDQNGDDVTATQVMTDYLVPPTKALTVNVYMEGLYAAAGMMNAASDDMGPHWGAGIADRLTVQLRDGITGALVYENTAVDLSTAGVAAVAVPSAHSGSYYIYLINRNHLTTSTAAPVDFTGAAILYDFDAASKAYGDVMKDLGDGNFGIFAGDVNQDNFVDSGDFTDVDNDVLNFVTGYVTTDTNGDSFVDTADFTIIDNNNSAFVQGMLPF